MPWLCNFNIGLAIRDGVSSSCVVNIEMSCEQFLVVVQRLLGISDLLLQSCILLCIILLVSVIVVSSFSQVCLIAWGITFKF